MGGEGGGLQFAFLSLFVLMAYVGKVDSALLLVDLTLFCVR